MTLRYKVPLSRCDVEIVLKGKDITPETFDTLQEFVRIFKKNKELGLSRDDTK